MNFPPSGAVSSCNERHYWESSPQQPYFQWIKADSHILLRTHPSATEAASMRLWGGRGWADPAIELWFFSFILLISS